jgi:LacI family transcriptional regulator
MREVAKEAGVAMSTVSRVISGHPDVSPEMRDRVQQVVAQLGYEPHFLAQSLRRGATFSIGFTLSDIANPVIAQYARGAEMVLRQAGYSMMVMNAENDPALDYAHIRFLQSRRVDGLLLLLASERKRATLDMLAKLQVPLVVIDRDLPKRLRASAVLCDHRAGMAAAVEYLLDLGHRRIALVSWPLDLRPGRERLAGLQEAFTARGLPDTSIQVLGPFTAEEGEQATAALLDSADPPTALIAGTNQLLVGCLRALTKRGLRPGEDLSLVTCDDIPLAELFTPSISTITRDNIAVGRTAAELLLHRLHGRADPETVVLPTTFVPGASCRPPAAPACGV